MRYKLFLFWLILLLNHGLFAESLLEPQSPNTSDSQQPPPVFTLETAKQQLNQWALDAELVQLQTQLFYAMKLAQSALSYVHAYENSYPHGLSTSHFNQFVRAILQNGSDQIVKTIILEKKEAQPLIKVTLQSSEFVHQSLRGETFVYNGESNWLEQILIDFVDVQLQQQQPSAPESTLLATSLSPFYLDVLYALGVITDYCLNPQGYQANHDKASDFEWCPSWHLFVMSP